MCHLSKHFVCKVAQDSLDQLEMTSRQVYHKADLNLSPSTKWFNLLTHQITYTNYAFLIRQPQHLVHSDASHTTRGMTVTVLYDQDILKGDFFMTLRWDFKCKCKIVDVYDCCFKNSCFWNMYLHKNVALICPLNEKFVLMI